MVARAPAKPPSPAILSLGTISFARCQDEMALSPAERTRLILAASDAYAPDLLVTAGYAVHNRKQLHRLAAEIADDPRDGVIIAEVHHDGRTQRQPGRGHAMWAIYGDGDLHRFGRQAFSTSKEARSPGGKPLARLLRHLPDRTIAVGQYRVFALVCGELNIVHGRETPASIDMEIGETILAADIVVNPTHDRMSNAGTLAAKRRFLSQPHPDGRARAYVSCSNWDACGLGGRVQHPSPTLHTVYVAGVPLPYDELADGAFGFVYRRWHLRLAGSG